MKGSLILFAGTLTGLSLIATPALSQSSTSPPSPSQRTPTTTRPMTGASENFRQAVQLLEGTWNVSVKMLGPGAKSFPTDSGQPGAELTATSTRNWMLNDKILVEDVRATGPGNSMGGQSFQGHGMFGYDSKTNEFQHVWTDSADSKICFSAGRYDERSRTFTFNKVKSADSLMRPTTTPGMTPPPPPLPPDSIPPAGTTPPGTRPPSGSGNFPDDNNQFMSQTTPTSPPAPASPPSTTPSGTQPPRPGMPDRAPASQIPDLDEVQRIVIRILDDNRHVIEYYTSATGTQNKAMEITYTKSR